MEELVLRPGVVGPAAVRPVPVHVNVHGRERVEGVDGGQALAAALQEKRKKEG